MPFHPSRHPQRGFSLVEVLFATVIAGYVIMSAWSVSGAVAAKHAMDTEPRQAARLAKEIYECAEVLPSTPSGTLAVTSGADIVALDSLIGARFSPPIFADGSADTTLTGWQQRVDLAVFALDDLTTPTGEDPAAGLGEHDDRLYQLNVTVLKDGAEIDTYCWWITP